MFRSFFSAVSADITRWRLCLSLAIVYFYLYRNGKSWKLAALTVVSILLCATHYLAYAGLYAALGCDYLLFGRRRQPLTLRQLFWVLAPQVTIGLILVWIYNPLNSSAVPVASRAKPAVGQTDANVVELA